MTANDLILILDRFFSGPVFIYADSGQHIPHSLGYVVIFGHRNQRREFHKMMRTQYEWRPVGIIVLFRELPHRVVSQHNRWVFCALPETISFDWKTKKARAITEEAVQ